MSTLSRTVAVLGSIARYPRRAGKTCISRPLMSWYRVLDDTPRKVAYIADTATGFCISLSCTKFGSILLRRVIILFVKRALAKQQANPTPKSFDAVKRYPPNRCANEYDLSTAKTFDGKLLASSLIQLLPPLPAHQGTIGELRAR